MLLVKQKLLGLLFLVSYTTMALTSVHPNTEHPAGYHSKWGYPFSNVLERTNAPGWELAMTIYHSAEGTVPRKECVTKVDNEFPVYHENNNDCLHAALLSVASVVHNSKEVHPGRIKYYQDIAGVFGKENRFGACAARRKVSCTDKLARGLKARRCW